MTHSNLGRNPAGANVEPLHRGTSAGAAGQAQQLQTIAEQLDDVSRAVSNVAADLGPGSGGAQAILSMGSALIDKLADSLETIAAEQ